MSTLPEPPKFARYIEITNPFDIKARFDKEVIVDGAVTLADVKPDKFNTYLACVSGEIIDESEWSSRIIEEGECIVFAPIPEGGGGGAKSVLRIVAIIALSVYAPQLALAIPGVTAGTAAAGFATGAIIAGGSMAINKLMPVKPQLPPAVESLETSQSYGIDGAKNTAREGIPVPVIYGTYRVAGNLIDFFTENTDDGNQDMFVRFALSEGQIDLVALDSVEVNDQPLSSYEGVELFWSDGAEEPSVYARNRAVSGSSKRFWNHHPFGASVNPVPVGVDLTDTMTERTTGTINSFRVDLVCPQGWRKLRDDGSSQVLNQDLEIVYTKLPSGSPQTLKSFTPLGEGTKETFYVYTHENGGYRKLPEPEYYDSIQYGVLDEATGLIRVSRRTRVRKDTYQTTWVTVGYRETVEIPNYTTRIAGKYASTYRLSFRSPPLSEGEYRIEVRRTSPESTNDKIIDKIVWSDLTEIVSERVKMKHTAWLGMKIRLSNQLNQLPKVTSIVNGRVVDVYDRDQTTGQVAITAAKVASSNPAWIALDMLTNKRYGAGVDISRIDLNAFLEWSEYCEEKDLQFHGVFDQGMTYWDAAEYVFRVGRAKPINLGTRFSVLCEKAEPPSMVFNVSNMVKGSFSIQWLPVAERANEIDVRYHDANDNYNENVVRVADPSVPGNETKRRMEMKLFGVTSADQAIQEAYLQLNLNRYVQQSCTFDVPIEAISCMPGDVVIVQHDVPAWGMGGRTRSSQPVSGVGLDRPLTSVDGNGSEIDLNGYSGSDEYELLLHYDRRLIQSDTVDAIVANRYIRLGSSDYPAGKIDRAVVSGVEYEVTDTFVDSLGEGVVLATTLPAGEVGNVIDLYETDALITHSVVSITTEQDASGNPLYSNVVTSPAVDNIDPFVKWVFGKVENTRKPFRITEISGDGDMTRTISCIEYNENVYVDGAALPPPNYSQLPKSVAHVSDIEISQDGQLASGVYQPIVFVSWKRPSDSRYRGARVQFRFQDETLWRDLKEVGIGETTYQHEGLVLGDLVEYRVVSKGTLSEAYENDAPRVAVEVINPPPLPVQSFVIEGSILSWSHPKDQRSLDHDGWEIRYHSGSRRTWDDALELHEGVLKSSPFNASGLVSGNVTFLIRSVDSSGQYDDADPIKFVETYIEGDAVRNAVLQHTVSEEGTLSAVDSLSNPPTGWDVYPTEGGGAIDELSWAREATPYGDEDAVLTYTNVADTGFSKLLESPQYVGFFDTTKRYRFSIALKTSDRFSNWQIKLNSNLQTLDTGSGVNTTSGATFLTGNTSPYITEALEGKWLLFVGEIWPEGTPNDSTKYGGVYDMETGAKLINPSATFKFGDTSGSNLADLTWFRMGMFDNTVGQDLKFYNLSFHVVDGTEPSIAELCQERPDLALNVLDTSMFRAMRYFNQVSLSQDAFVVNQTQVRGSEVGTFYPTNGSSPFYNPDDTSGLYETQYNAFEVIMELDRSTAFDYDVADIGNPLQFFFNLSSSDVTATLSLSKGSWDLVDGERVWIPSDGRATVEEGEVYFFKISIPSYFGAQPPTITDMGYFVDLPDIVERWNDLQMVNGEIQLPIVRNYREIVFVTLTLQSNQSPVSSVKLIDKDVINGPTIRAYDYNGNQISAAVNGDWPLIDATIRGY